MAEKAQPDEVSPAEFRFEDGSHDSKFGTPAPHEGQFATPIQTDDDGLIDDSRERITP
jgi:hypothetical protein